MIGQLWSKFESRNLNLDIGVSCYDEPEKEIVFGTHSVCFVLS